jgi:hypothetical protein
MDINNRMRGISGRAKRWMIFGLVLTEQESEVTKNDESASYETGAYCLGEATFRGRMPCFYRQESATNLSMWQRAWHYYPRGCEYS